MKEEKGFTIIELLVAMAILGLLMAVMIPGIAVVRRGARNTARRTGASAIQGKIEDYYGTYRKYPESLINGNSCKAGDGKLCLTSRDVDKQFTTISVGKHSGAVVKTEFDVSYSLETDGYKLTVYMEPNSEPYVLDSSD